MPLHAQPTMTPEEEERWQADLLEARESRRSAHRHYWRKLAYRYLRRYAIDSTVPFGMLYKIGQRYEMETGKVFKFDVPYRKVNALEWGNIVARCVRNQSSTSTR